MKHSLRLYLFAGLSGLASVSVRAQTAPPTTPVPAPAAVPATAPAATAGTPVGTGLLLPPSLVKTKYKVYLNQRYAGDKEALAAIHMFGRKQTGGALWLAGGATFLGILTSQTGTRTSGSGTTTFTVSPLGYVVFTALPAGIALGKFSRFGNGELYKLLLDYDKSHSFPGYVTGKLSKSDYQ